MSKAEKRKYTREFRAEAVKLVLERGMSLEEAGASLALPKGTLANWVAAAKRGDGAAAAPGGRSVSELEAEVARLRKELANANVEVEILKNVWSAPILQTAFVHDRRTFCVNVFGLRLEAVLPALMESARPLPHKAFSHYRLLF